MIRIGVRDGKAIVEAGEHLSGRGGYLHPRQDCIERFVGAKLRVFRSLRRELNPSQRALIAETIRRRLDRDPQV